MTQTLPTIRTVRLVLEPLRVETVDRLFDVEWRIERSKAPALHRSDGDVRERLRRWAEIADAGRPSGTWMIGGEGRILGRAGLDRADDAQHVHLSYALAPDARGRGLATEAACAIRDWLFQVHDATELRAVIRPTNNASVAVVKRLGMIEDPDADRHNLVFCARRPG